MQPLPPHLPGLIAALAPLVGKYGYLAVGVLLFVENFGIPVPGETTLITASFFAGFGHLNIVVVFFVALLASILGDNVGFAIGNNGGRPLVERIGKYVFMTPKRLDKAEAFFNRNGGKIVLVARFIEGLRQFNGIIAGISEMRWKKFLLFNTIGATLWVATWCCVGYFGGSQIEKIHTYGTYVSIAGVLAVVGFIAYHILKRKRHAAKAATVKHQK